MTQKVNGRTISQIARAGNVTRETVSERIKRGWPPERLSEPAMQHWKRSFSDPSVQAKAQANRRPVGCPPGQIRGPKKVWKAIQERGSIYLGPCDFCGQDLYTPASKVGRDIVHPECVKLAGALVQE